MAPISHQDQLSLRAKVFRLDLDVEKFCLMPREMYLDFLSFHKDLPTWSASGSVSWGDVNHASMDWEDEAVFPQRFLDDAAITKFPEVGIVYSSDFSDGYIYRGNVSDIPLDVFSLCNGPAFAAGIDHENMYHQSLLEFRWPNQFNAMI